MAKLRKMPLYRATTRPMLFMGGERELMLSLIILCTALVFVTISWPSFIIGASLWLTGTVMLRVMAKRDPMMSKVFLRFWNNFRQPYYEARPKLTSRGFRAKKGRRS